MEHGNPITSIQALDPDALLQEILSSPSGPSSLIVAIAEQLEDEPFLLATWRVISDAIREAADQVLEGLPEIIATETVLIANAAMPLPYPGEQTGPYAVRLRVAAEHV